MRLSQEPGHALHVTSPAIRSLQDFPPHFAQALLRAGFTTASEIILLRPEALRLKAGLSEAHVKEVYDRLARLCAPSPATIVELSSHQGSFISLGSPGLDRLFGALPGGVPVGLLTEIAGESATGKTCLSIQLSLNVQLPLHRGGLGGGCVYLCTESAFPSSRLRQMASALCLGRTTGASLLDRRCPGQEGSRSEALDVDGLMENVHLSRVKDSQTLIHTIHYSLPVFLKRQRSKIGTKSLPIRLIVLDSVGAIFRTDFEANKLRDSRAMMAQRAAELNQVADGLKYLASREDLAVVVVNQVSDVFETPGRSFNPLEKHLDSDKLGSPAGSGPRSESGDGSARELELLAGSPLDTTIQTSSPPVLPPGLEAELPVGFLNYLSQAYHFSGQAVSGNRKEAALGLAWTNTINSRIMLHSLGLQLSSSPRTSPLVPSHHLYHQASIDPTPLRVREARIVFSPFGPTPLDLQGHGIKYVISQPGIVALET